MDISQAQPTSCPRIRRDLPPATAPPLRWQDRAPRTWFFYPARGEGGGQAREAEQICSARHLLPALQKTADGASFESVAFSAQARGCLPLSFYPWLIKGKSLPKEHSSSELSLNN